MLLDHLGQHDAAMAVEKAIAAVLANSGARTPDIGGTASTSDLGDAVASCI